MEHTVPGVHHLDPRMAEAPENYTSQQLGEALRDRFRHEQCQPYDRVLRGRVLKAVKEHLRYQEDPRGRRGFYAWAKSYCDIGPTMTDNYVAIAGMPDALAQRYNLSIEKMKIVTAADERLQELIAELGEQRISDEKLRQAAGAGT